MNLEFGNETPTLLLKTDIDSMVSAKQFIVIFALKNRTFSCNLEYLEIAAIYFFLISKTSNTFRFLIYLHVAALNIKPTSYCFN